MRLEGLFIHSDDDIETRGAADSNGCRRVVEVDLGNSILWYTLVSSVTNGLSVLLKIRQLQDNKLNTGTKIT